MEILDDVFGLFPRLRERGFWAYFTVVAVLVFVALTTVDLAMPYVYRSELPSLDVNLAWDLGINVVVGVLSGGIAWASDGKPWINRPDTIKLDLDK